MILLAATGANNAQVARRLDTTANTVGKWRSCWLATEADLLTAEAEGLTEEEPTALVEAMLADAGVQVLLTPLVQPSVNSLRV